jgi:hypothetical protein
MRVQRWFEGAEKQPWARGNRHDDGDRPSLSVWCSHMMAAPAERNAIGTRGQRMPAPKAHGRKNPKIRA